MKKLYLELIVFYRNHLLTPKECSQHSEEGNVLLLDEPTNDLDVNTLRALEEGLENFAGCAVVISHDRWFLDRVCTHILAFEGDSQVYFFEGSFSEYEENKKKRVGGDLMPKRIKYKKLIRKKKDRQLAVFFLISSFFRSHSFFNLSFFLQNRFF